MITIEDEILTGNLRSNLIKVVNLSSAPSEFIGNFLTEKVNNNKIKVLPIPVIPSASHFGHNMMSNRKRIGVHFIIDEDDTYADIKIRNLGLLMKYAPLGKIVIKKLENRAHTKMTGLTINLVTQHARKTVRDNLAASDMFIGETESIYSANIMQLTDKTCSSIAGLTWYCVRNNVQYNIKITNISTNIKWILLPTDKINDIQVISHQQITDTVPEADKRWQFRASYTDLLSTTSGPKQFTVKKHHETIIDQVVTSFYDIIKNKLFSIANWVKKTTIKIISFAKNMVLKRKKQNEGLCFSIVYETFPHVMSLISYSYSKQIKENASKEIKTANQLMSRWHVNRLAVKPTASSNKTKLLDSISSTMASYIVASMNFNTQDAIMTADMEAARECVKVRSQIMTTNVICSVASCLIGGFKHRIPLIVLLNIGAHLFNEQSKCILVTSILSPTNIVSKAVATVLIMAESHPSTPQKIKKKALPYIAVLLLVVQIITGLI